MWSPRARPLPRPTATTRSTSIVASERALTDTLEEVAWCELAGESMAAAYEVRRGSPELIPA
jgi:hypothetical protein